MERATIYVCISVLLALLSPMVEAGSWVFKNFSVELPPDNGQVTNNISVETVSASNGLAQMRSQIKPGYPHEDAGKSFASRASWEVPPTVLKPGQEIAINLAVAPTDTTLPGHWHVYHSVTFHVGSSQGGKNWVRGTSLVSTGTGSAGGNAKEGRARHTWVVPSGKAGQSIALIFLGSPKFQVAYEYQWDDKNAPAAPMPAPDSTDPTLPRGGKLLADLSGRKDSGARFTKLSGQVEVLRDGETEWRFAKREMVIYYGDMIRTSEDSVAELGFSDMSTFKMRPESQIYLPEPERDSKIKLVFGNIWVNVKKMIKDGSMEIETNQAVTGIKGTSFELADNGTASVLRVDSGLVAFRHKGSKASRDVGPGQVATATLSGLQDGDPFGLLKPNRAADSNPAQASPSTDEQKQGSSQIRFASTRLLKIHPSINHSFGDVIAQIEDPARKTFIPVAVWREDGLGRGSTLLAAKRQHPEYGECLEFAIAFVTEEKNAQSADFARMACRKSPAENYEIRSDIPVTIETQRLNRARSFLPPPGLKTGDFWRVENSDKPTAHSSLAALVIGLNVNPASMPITKLWESVSSRGAAHVYASPQAGCARVVLKTDYPPSNLPPFTAEYCRLQESGKQQNNGWGRSSVASLPPEEVAAALKNIDKTLQRASEAKWWNGIIE